MSEVKCQLISIKVTLLHAKRNRFVMKWNVSEVKGKDVRNSAVVLHTNLNGSNLKQFIAVVRKKYICIKVIL